MQYLLLLGYTQTDEDVIRFMNVVGLPAEIETDASSKSSQPTGSPNKSNHVELMQTSRRRAVETTLQIHFVRVVHPLTETRRFLRHLRRVNISATSDMWLLWTSDDSRVKFYLTTSSMDDPTRPLKAMPRRPGFQVFAPTYTMRGVDDLENNTSDSRIVACGLPLSLKHSELSESRSILITFTRTLVVRATAGTWANQIWMLPDWPAAMNRLSATILRAPVLMKTAVPACLFLGCAHKSVSERDLLRLSSESEEYHTPLRPRNVKRIHLPWFPNLIVSSLAVNDLTLGLIKFDAIYWYYLGASGQLSRASILRNWGLVEVYTGDEDFQDIEAIRPLSLRGYLVT
ncbi:hypothetical protein BU15DRAFT_66027 [Melanogaster broomeanus]|nr:hypothetical protein BU15DRAFT_66027 [Melanogaster broomeanus]